MASLIPDKPSEAPDYFCTWTVQGYLVNFASAEATRNEMKEENIFGNAARQNWSGMLQKVRSDLYFLLDDSWDVPFNNDKKYFGSLIVDSSRFPSVSNQAPAQRLKTISDRIKRTGWKGLGLWICAQQAPEFEKTDSTTYWRQRMQWMDSADVRYWKVDWGEKDKNASWRTFLTRVGQEKAPRLNIEQSMTPSVMSAGGLYRTYDVESIISVPLTISRIGKLLNTLPAGKATAMINCEDEAYIAVGTGCSIGVMRHEFNGSMPNGNQDFVFPPVGRDYKNRLDEVVRAVRWHRIAGPFAINKSNVFVDRTELHDYWVLASNETWMSRKAGDTDAMSAPQVITRGIEKPQVSQKNGDTLRPYVLASKYPNGAIAVVTVGRTVNRSYLTPSADVTIKAGDLTKPIGIFGRYNSLTLELRSEPGYKSVFAQDLAGEKPVDITTRVIIQGNKVIIPGSLIDEIGLSAASKGGKSEPGMVLEFFE